MDIRLGTSPAKYWNEELFPLIGQGKLKDISNELPTGFLVFGQCMEAKFQDVETGKVYFATGWSGPGAHVSISEIEE